MKTFELTFLGQLIARQVAYSLIDASQWFAVEPLPDDHWCIAVKQENEARLRALFPTHQVPPAPLPFDLPVVPDSGGVMRNDLQGVFVLPHADAGFTCAGYSRVLDLTTRMADWLGDESLLPGEVGTDKAWACYQRALAAAKTHAQALNIKCPVNLTSRLIGLEGKRIRVTHANGETETYRVGRSTGWMPCHLAIEKRGDDGGPAVYLPSDSTIEVLSR